jgi:hypothetical protein
MRGFVSKWDPESRNGEIHACPQNQFYALLGADNPDVADQLDAIYPNGFNSSAACPGPPGCVQVTFDPGADDTAQNVSIVSQATADPRQLAQQASMHAAAATQHADALKAIEGVQPKALAAAHSAAATAHSAAATALAAAVQGQGPSKAPSDRPPSSAPKSPKRKGRR